MWAAAALPGRPGSSWVRVGAPGWSGCPDVTSHSPQVRCYHKKRFNWISSCKTRGDTGWKHSLGKSPETQRIHFNVDPRNGLTNSVQCVSVFHAELSGCGGRSTLLAPARPAKDKLQRGRGWRQGHVPGAGVLPDGAGDRRLLPLVKSTC